MTQWYQYPITHGFYSQYDPNIPDTPHFANDIETPFHTSLTAFKPGMIVQEDYAAWGGEVFERPDDGGPEIMFAHLDDINVKNGQHVNVGDSLGLSGGQTSGGDHPTSPAYSTGPHTHVQYFTGYVWDNQAGRYIGQGPDITGTISQLRAMGPQSIASPTPTQQNAINTNQPQGMSAFAKIGIFVLAIVFIGAGFYMLFKNQINSALKVAAKVA